MQAPRDLTYIKPRRRRLTEYEAVTCFTQPDPSAYDQEGWFLLREDGRPAWRKESTALRHHDWYSYRDPSSLWQRTYVRLQAEQERAIERLTEDMASSQGLSDVDPHWLLDIIGSHYGVWSFFEYGMFRVFARAQREALSDTLGTALCFESMDRIRHAQAIVLYVMDLQNAGLSVGENSAKERWTLEPAYQPLRRLTEELMATADWAEVSVAVNLIVDPIVSEIGMSQMVRRCGVLHGDVVSPVIATTAERDRRRNSTWTEELIRMVLDERCEFAGANRAVLQGWADQWLPKAREAAGALREIYQRIPRRPGDFDSLLQTTAENAERKIAAVLQPAHN
jgi:hypothetical protein